MCFFYLFAPTRILRDIDVKMRMREAAFALRRVDVRVPRPLALAACRACSQLGTGVCTWYLARVRTYVHGLIHASCHGGMGAADEYGINWDPYLESALGMVDRY